MGLLFVNQTALDIEVKVCTDITGARELLIKYIKPDGTVGSFPAVSIDNTEGILQYSVVSENDIDQIGRWVFWAHVTFVDGRSAPGETFEQWFYPEGYIKR